MWVSKCSRLSNVNCFKMSTFIKSFEMSMFCNTIHVEMRFNQYIDSRVIGKYGLLVYLPVKTNSDSINIYILICIS